MAKTKVIKESSAMMCEIGTVKEKYHEYFGLEKKYNEMYHFVDKLFIAGICICATHIIATVISVL